jgi:hypothetical protein
MKRGMMMLDDSNPFSKFEVIENLRNANHKVTTYFSSLSPQQFFDHPPEVWSPAENLQHLIQSVSPIAQALGVPSEALHKRFGISERSSRPYSEIVKLYRAELAKGAVSSEQYIPVLDGLGLPGDPQMAQDEILRNWERVSEGLLDILERQSDDDLDRTQLPHPLLGQMTMRELLLWTAYHNQHHVEDAQRLEV